MSYINRSYTNSSFNIHYIAPGGTMLSFSFPWKTSTPSPSLPASQHSTPPPADDPSPPRDSSNLHREWEYDLFVSYRGSDVKETFRPHLFAALKRNNIRLFRDDDPDSRGEELNKSIFGAIPRSRVAVVILSPSFADSPWCLNELVEILKCQRQYSIHGCQSTIYPIFFEVKVGDVQNQTGVFGDRFKQMHKRKRKTTDEVKEWKVALGIVATLAGVKLEEDCHGDGYLLIENIIAWLRSRDIPNRYRDYGKEVIGRDQDAKDVISLYSSNIITNQKINTRAIGIYGIQGVGKTWLAKLLISLTCPSNVFEYVHFLTNVRERTLNDLARELPGIISSARRSLQFDIHDQIRPPNVKLQGLKVLLVFDDVDVGIKDHVNEFLRDREMFGCGSIILITTSNEGVLDELKVDERYMVSALSAEGSQQLFCRRTFKTDAPLHGYGKLCANLCHYTGGHPEKLMALGSYFGSSNRTIPEWQKALDQLSRNPRSDPCRSNYPQKVGPFPELTTNSFDDKECTGVRQIEIITVESMIESITIDYDQNGCLVRSARYGGTLPGESYMIKLDYPREYLTSVSSFISEDDNPEVIQSLQIRSNVKQYKCYPAGKQGTQKLEILEAENAKITGFCGSTSGASLCSIGAYFEQIPDQFPFKKVGPFGGQAIGGWDDGKHTDIRQIDVFIHNSAVESISIWYDDHGRPTKFEHGESARGKPYSVKLDFPQEYLMSMSGYVTKDGNGISRISAITLESNRQDHWLFGEKIGRKFAFPTKCGKIVGFYGKFHGQHLEAMGAHYELVSHIYPFKIFGPFGGESGESWDDEKHTDIKSITIKYGRIINSIICAYEDHGQGVARGGSGIHKKLISLAPGEHITSMSGYISEQPSSVVNSITFHSDRRIWGPFGTEKGKYFSLPLNSGKIVGFYGRADNCCITSIGAHFETYSSKQYPFKSVRLFGREGRDDWDDKRSTNIRRIEITIDSIVKSMKIDYEDARGSLRSCSHGPYVRGNIKTITLDDDEYLTSLSGYYNDEGGCLRSLMFQSNKRTCGPFGSMTGEYFCAPATGGKIVGFYGTENGFGLTSIGAYFEPISHLYPAKRVGPFGGQGLDSWCAPNSNMVSHGGDFWCLPKSNTRGVRILHDKASIVRIYALNEKGNPIGSSRRSPTDQAIHSNPQLKVDEVTLSDPNEYLTSISGYINNYSDPVTVRSIIFQTNKRSYGPFGRKTPKGSYFWYPSTGGRIVSFYGYRTSSHLSSIGVYTEPISHLYPCKSIGPYGGQKGVRWDDGIFTDVRAIHIQYYESAIVAFRVEYDNNGSPIRCPEHGNDLSYMVCNSSAEAGKGGLFSTLGKRKRQVQPKSVTIKLDYPKEHLVMISGFSGKKYCEEVIRCLTVKTNLKTSPTYGSPKGNPFQLPEEENCGRIIGFHGTSGRFLNSLGARLEPF